MQIQANCNAIARFTPKAAALLTALLEAASRHEGAVAHSGLRRTWLSYHLGLIGCARIKAGQPSEAMKAVEEAIYLVETTGERFYSAELCRLRDELSLKCQSVSATKPESVTSQEVTAVHVMQAC